MRRKTARSTVPAPIEMTKAYSDGAMPAAKANLPNGNVNPRKAPVRTSSAGAEFRNGMEFIR
jgi:hypothetical protein